MCICICVCICISMSIYIYIHIYIHIYAQVAFDWCLLVLLINTLATWRRPHVLTRMRRGGAAMMHDQAMAISACIAYLKKTGLQTLPYIRHGRFATSGTPHDRRLVCLYQSRYESRSRSTINLGIDKITVMQPSQSMNATSSGGKQASRRHAV